MRISPVPNFSLNCLVAAMLSAGLLNSTAWAQEAASELHKVEITGSSIKRIVKEGALPVQQLSQEAIRASGAVSVADLIQRLPAMQGFTPIAAAVGSDSGGRASASIHNIGESYTLVLLNGRRLAPQGSGNTVNLNAIPMSAVERVEILTDGASALYGSDAIAGVVNFILKRDQQGASLEANFSNPLAGGAKSAYASLTYGTGQLSQDGYQLLLSYRHDQQQQLASVERDYSSTAYLPFRFAGKDYVFDRTSMYTVPANVILRFNDKSVPSTMFNPYLKRNGNCGPQQVVNLNNPNACAFDYAASLETVPESQRDSLFATGRYRLSSGWQWFTDLAAARYDITTRIAPNPVPINIPLNSAYYRQAILPYLSPAEAAAIRSASASYRMQDWGQRAGNTITSARHLVTGLEGDYLGWHISSALTYSYNSLDEKLAGGYVQAQALRSMIASGSIDPFLPAGQQTAEQQRLIASSMFKGTVRSNSTTLAGIDARASRELFELQGGAASLGLGGDMRRYSYFQDPTLASANGEVYDLATPPSYALARDVYGVFAELLLPLSEHMEITTSLRHDRYAAIEDKLLQRQVGDNSNATTYKISARYQPSPKWLLRASYGTGFKMPSMLDIARPLVRFGFTDNWVCPFPDSDYCKPGQAQYALLNGGNPALKPERSNQFSMGLRYEPSSDLSLGLDFWNVEIRDKVSSISEALAFNDPQRYASLFVPNKEVATDETYWAFKNLSLNVGRSETRGIDWDLLSRHKLAIGTLTATVNGSYLLKSKATIPGSSTVWDSDLGRYGIYNTVGFRHIISASASLQQGRLNNMLTLNYRTAYRDSEAIVRNLASGLDETLRLEVPSYATLDWQGKYQWSKALEIRAGIKNLLNQAPHRSLQSGAGGHHNGFDARFSDLLLRSAYLTAKYDF